MALSENDQRELQRVRRKGDTIRGPGVRHTKDTVYIGRPRPVQAKKTAPVTKGLWVFITAAEAGAGKYTGREFTFNSGPVSPSDNVVYTGLGTVGTEVLLVVNMFEETWSTGHLLTDGDVQNARFFPAWWHPRGARDTAGRRVCLINAIDIFICSTQPSSGEFLSF